MDHGEIKGKIVYSITNKPMREYKIFKTDLWFWIYKKLEKDGRLSLWFLSWNEQWTLRKDFAKTFYHRDDATAALVIMKHKDEQKSD